MSLARHPQHPSRDGRRRFTPRRSRSPRHARRRSWHPRLPGRLWLRAALAVATVAAAAGGTLAGQAAAAGSPPGAPTLVSASASGTSVTLTWTNGSGAQGANAYQNGVKHWVGGSPNPVPTTYTYTGLANGTYTYQVANYNGAGQGPLSNSMTATVGGTPPPAPTVTSLSVTSGDENGGTALTVNGTNFTGATAVDFGATAATAFTVTGPGTLSATSPAATSTGPVDVTVTTPGGKSAVNQPGDQFTYTTPPAPTVTLVNPNTGPANTSVNVSGTDFTGATAVDFGTTPATTFTVNSNTTLQATAPSGTGTVDVTVTTPSGTSALNSNDQFTYGSGTPPTTIPSPVTKTGWQFNGTATVVTTASPQNLQLTPATTYKAGSAFYTTAVPGVGISAAFDAQIHGGSGADGLCLVLADASVTSPTALGVDGGGEGFSGIKGIALSLDTYKNSVNPSNNFVGIATGPGPYSASLHYVTTNSSISSLRTGTHHFVLTTFSTGLSVTMDNQQVLAYATTLPANVLVGFTAGTGGLTDIHAVQNVSITAGPPPPAPAVTGLSPTHGPQAGATSVVISGNNLSGATGVQFGGMKATSFTNNPDGTITAVSPPGTGTVDVLVTTGGGTSAVAQPADQFTYDPPPPPAVTSVSPTSGPNGTPVTITGSGFTGASAVDFGSGNSATFKVDSDGQITATAPPGTSTVDVTVTGTGGTSATSSADQFAYTIPPQPTVTGVSPASGPSGTSVTISGTNLTATSAVDFGTGNSAATFAVVNDGEVTATAPTGTGTVDVTVTTSGGTSPVNQPADQFQYTTTTPGGILGMYRGDLGHSGYYPSETGLTTSNASTLKAHWTASGGSNSFAQPIVANNLVYWSDWKGNEHATDLSGGSVWSTNLGTETPPSSQNCQPASVGVSSTPTISTLGSTPVLYVGGGDGNFYALNATTGALIWKTNLGAPPNNTLWGSPELYNGSIYEGVASFGDCPLVVGKLYRLDATTGAIQNTFSTTTSSCPGSGIWGSPTIDTATGDVYVVTGNPSCNATYGPAIVQLNASNLTVISHWVVPTSEQSAGDADFGSTPVLFTATIGGTLKQLVGSVNKDGIFFAFDRANISAGPVWQATLANPSGDPAKGSIISAAWDGTRLIVAGGNTTVNGGSCTASINALNPVNGTFLWRTCQSSHMFGGITEVPGVIVEGNLSGTVLFLNASSGATLKAYSVGSSEVEGECTVSNGVVYIPFGTGSLVAIGQ